VLRELPGRRTVSGGLKAEHRSFPGTIEVKICPILGRSHLIVNRSTRIGIARHAASTLPIFSINAATQRADLSAPRALDRRVAACVRGCRVAPGLDAQAIPAFSFHAVRFSYHSRTHWSFHRAVGFQESPKPENSRLRHPFWRYRDRFEVRQKRLCVNTSFLGRSGTSSNH
jgi:hypothetical protein